MRVSVGLLYSSTELLRMVESGTLLDKNFPTIFTRFESVAGQAVFDFSLEMRWIHFDPTGKLVASPRGKEILLEGADEKILRCQLYDVIKYLPQPWATTLHNGRKEASAAFNPDIRQVFNEAGLMVSDPGDDIVSWWDNVSLLTRSWRSANNMSTGRAGERLSMNYEKQRTGTDPLWLAVESNFVGYDILSVQGGGSAENLMIEVKASVQKPKEASFIVSRNEWGIASGPKKYCFHLWCLGKPNKLYVVPSDLLLDHVPSDNGSGRWADVKVPFKTFSNCEVPIS